MDALGTNAAIQITTVPRSHQSLHTSYRVCGKASKNSGTMLTAAFNALISNHRRASGLDLE